MASRIFANYSVQKKIVLLVALVLYVGIGLWMLLNPARTIVWWAEAYNDVGDNKSDVYIANSKGEYAVAKNVPASVHDVMARESYFELEETVGDVSRFRFPIGAIAELSIMSLDSYGFEMATSDAVDMGNRMPSLSEINKPMTTRLVVFAIVTVACLFACTVVIFKKNKK